MQIDSNSKFLSLLRKKQREFSPQLKKGFTGVHGKKGAYVERKNGRLTLETWGEELEPEGEIVSGLDAKEVLVRHLCLKLKKKREIFAALPFQIEDLIPYTEEERILHTTLYPKGEETDIFVMATTKELVERHLAKQTKEPDIVSSIPSALYRFVTKFFPNYPSLFVWQEGNLVVIEKGKIASSHFVKEGETQRMQAYLEKKFPEITSILLPSKEQNPFPSLKVVPFENEELGRYAIPIGLAFDGASQDAMSCQFRERGNESKKQKQKRSRQLTHVGILCAGFIATILLLGHVQLKKRENALLAALDAPKGMSLAQYADTIEHKLYKQKKTKLSLPTIPNVSETLAWLSTHPSLQEEFSLTKFRYLIDKAPSLGSQARTFSAKVELTVQTENSRAARNFYQALLKDTKIVDQKRDVKWSSDHGTYTATFYLRGKKDG